MTVWEILLIGVALSMDAVAVGMTDGMTEPEMNFRKALTIAGAFALFQIAMPLLGYCAGAVFAYWVEKIAPWLSFALLAFIGGKMIFDCVREAKGSGETRGRVFRKKNGLGSVKLLAQAFATSIDALAVGVTLLAAEKTGGLPFSAVFCALVIGAVTLTLSLAAVYTGKKAGDLFADKAEVLGGAILLVIGVKILAESFL